MQMKENLHERNFGGVDGSFGLNPKDSAGDLSVMPSHMADLGTDSFDRDMQLNIASGDSDVLKQIEEALDRLNNGNYDICEMCGKK